MFYDEQLPVFENCAVYEIFGKVLYSGVGHITIWCMCLVCGGVPKATNTHSEYVILVAFPLQQLLHERASILRYMCNECKM
jgi:hypothetical protein